jgi:helix-turn-helix protein
MGAHSISPNFSPNLSRGRTSTSPRRRLQLLRESVHNLISARAVSVQHRTARGRVGFEELQLDRAVSVTDQAMRVLLRLEHYLDLDKPLGAHRASRDPLKRPVGRLSCQVRNSAHPAGSRAKQEGGISRRSRMSNTEHRSSPTNLLTERQAAEWLHHSLSTLRRWRRAGHGPNFVRFGRMILYRAEDLESFITTHLSTQGTAP